MWPHEKAVPGKPVALNVGYFVSIMGYFGVWWPVDLGCLAFLGSSCCPIERLYAEILGSLRVAQNNRPLYPKVTHKAAKVAPNYRLLAFQVPSSGLW